jgi:hypothetical protein
VRIYIASRLRAFTSSVGRVHSIEENVDHARQLVHDVALAGHEPFAPHVLMAGCLDDDVPAEREAGLRVGLSWLRMADELWFDGRFGISSGMATEIAEARKLTIPVTEKWPCT